MTDRDPQIVLAGWAVHVPGRTAAELPGSPQEPACSAADAKLVLGRKGLLGKEPATRLALCAVHRALGVPPGRTPGPVDQAAGTAVVVASNLGNVETVCTMVSDMREGGGAAVSVLDAPNASSNIIASSIAIRYGFTGPNLAVCSGATAGLDAVQLAARLLRAGRARRAVVVGVEPADPVARDLEALRPDGGALTEGAGCVLLGVPGAWTGRATVTIGSVERHGLRPAGAEPGVGSHYGADGVIGLAVAAERLASGQATGPLTVACGDREDAWAAVTASRLEPIGSAA
ncbi:3-oxoacyl-ACP synthase [Streptomyces actinomycinicus]|uniref:3-oxoacyl-ACP synthase n=1 Tax=Streptomyces actinomycinicus TaxID=1695166 RepID=A0A937EE96_9ACTN|nr:beta-ketoacyl synthase N-terminal-like domain-containing protein [Streptomyces actinomycinicus]MBL1081156.1 3-oxoacyl-ACP synthase [Streptomyces actinomycinicus]